MTLHYMLQKSLDVVATLRVKVPSNFKGVCRCCHCISLNAVALGNKIHSDYWQQGRNDLQMNRNSGGNILIYKIQNCLGKIIFMLCFKIYFNMRASEGCSTCIKFS